MGAIGLYCKESDDRAKMPDVLTRHNYTPFHIQSSEELFYLLPKERIGVTVIDYNTPDGQNGFIVSKQLREKPDTRPVSIILKIDQNDDLSKEMSSQGVNDFLLSPFHEEEFISLVDKLTNIEKRRPFQSLIRLHLEDGSVMGKTLNISSTGLLVQVPRELSIGSCININFFLPHSKEEIRCRATIRRRAHERLTFNPCYGVEFESIAEKQKNKLEKFVKRW